MRSNIQKYLAMAENSANQRIMSANGERHFGADGFIDQSLYFTNDLNPGGFYPADGGDGGGAAAAASLSQPYIITVSNASAAQVNNFNIWGANIYLGNTFTNGSLTISGITLTAAVGNSNITYYTMLQQSLTNNFTVGKTYLTVLSGSNAQAIQPLTVNTYDMNGNTAGKLLPSPLSPMQYQAGVYENNFPYRIDGFTTVSLNILASAVFQIYFYPSYNINPARALGDRNMGRQFAAPQLTPVQPVKQIG
jgi:hypothetical protein